MIYLNNAATSWPKPDCVGKAMLKAIESPPGEHLRGGFGGTDIFEQVRKELAFLLNEENPSRIALGCSATWALNTAIFGMDLKKGDCVVSTKAEHNSVLRPLYALKSQGIQVILVDTDGQGRVDFQKWTSAVKQYRPRLAILTNASNVTGAVNDVQQLSIPVKEINSILLLDCSQTFGCLSVNSRELGADLIAFTGHKYLLGPQGTGGLWVREGLQLKPWMVGGTGVRSDLHFMPEEMPLHLEAGTGSEPPCAGLLAALLWQKHNPINYQDLMEKTQYLSDKLQKIGADVVSVSGPRTPVITFSLPEIPASEAGYLLREGCGIACRTGLHCAPLIFPCLHKKETIRFSLSRFTTNDDIEAAVQAVEAILP